MTNDIIYEAYYIKPSLIVDDQSNKFGYIYTEYNEKHICNIFTDGYIQAKINKENDSFLSYTIEGSTDDFIGNITIYVGNTFFNSIDGNTFYLNVKDENMYKVYVNNVLMPINEIKQDKYDLGEITGNVNVANCGVENIDDLTILCFKSYTHRFIGEFKIENNVYKIPNLDVNFNYDIILKDKSKKIEQKVASYRTPTPYINNQNKPYTITDEKVFYDDYKILVKWNYNLNEPNIINDYFKVYYSSGEIDINNLDFYESIKTNSFKVDLDRGDIRYIFITSNYKNKINFSKLIEIKNNISEINGVYNA